MSPPVAREQNIVSRMSVWVFACLSVCLLVRKHISASTRPVFTNFRYFGSVFIWRRCDTLCSSVFMDDAMFAHNGQNG